MSEAGFSIRPLPVGAEVVGLAAGSEEDPEVRAALHAAWLEHGFLVFRNVDTPEQHLALSESFGELEIHPLVEARAKEDERFVEIGGNKTLPAYVFDGAELRVNRLPWHRDTAFTPDVCKGAMLRMLEVPEEGGETLIADTAMAYDALPAELKERLDSLEYTTTMRISLLDKTRPGALWKSVREATPEEDPDYDSRIRYDFAAAAARYPSVVHPVVIAHPDTGRKLIFLSPTDADGFLGMDQAASDALLEQLVEHMVQPRFVYTHHWHVNEAIVWDNRRVIHAALGNKLDGARRRGLRTTLATQFRPGRYFDPAAPDTAPVLAK